MLTVALAVASSPIGAAAGGHNIIMYLTGSVIITFPCMGALDRYTILTSSSLRSQHVVVPSRDVASPITHVILAFLRSEVFHVEKLPTSAADYPLFMSVEKVRTHFEPETKVAVAVGGWGDSEGFEAAARNETSRKEWAEQVKHMVDLTGADGVDIDWEYPG